MTLHANQDQVALLSFEPCVVVQYTVKRDIIPPRPWCYI